MTGEFSCRLGSIFIFNILKRNIITELDLFLDDVIYYEITLMHLLTIFSYLLISWKYNVNFFIAIANDHEITKKKKKNKYQVRTPMISKRLFFVETKKYKSSKDFCTTTLNK